jgi:hypothetical protein
MNITVTELRRITNAIFDELESSGQGPVELTSDYYWNIPSERLYAVEPPPIDSLDLGQLTSDWEELSAVGRENDPVPSHDLVHLAAVLRFVASKVLP